MNQLNFDLDFLWKVGNSVVLALLGIWSWQKQRDKDQDKRLSNLERAFADKVAEHEVRLAKMEKDMEHMPKSTEVARIAEALDQLGKQNERLNRGLDRINEFLLEHK